MKLQNSSSAQKADQRILLHRSVHISRLQAAGFAVTMAIVGAVVVFAIFAAGTPIAFEAEAGTLAGCAATVSDSNASGGSAVKFNSCSTGDTTTPTNLDASGATIPDSNYAVPSGAIFMATSGSDSNAGTQSSPVKTLNKAVSLAPSGGTIVVRGGTDANPAVYHDWYSYYNTTLATNVFGVVSKPVTIQAYAHEKAWFDGTDVEPAANWTSDGAGHWYMDWSTPSFCGTVPTATTSNYYSTSLASQNIGATGGTTNGPCVWKDTSLDPTNPMAGDPQMVFANGTYEHEATSLSGASGGAFYYDWANKRIYISTNPSGSTIELAARPMAMQLNGAGSKVLGLGFKRYATHVYSNNSGVIYSGATDQVFENDVFTKNAGLALAVTHAANAVVNHSVFAFNGGDGLGAGGSVASGGTDNFVVHNNVFNNNNSELFWTNCSYSCGAGNMKLDKMAGYTVANNIIENAAGQAWGTWCDEACTNGKTVNNVMSGNGDGGVVYEISDTGIIASNLIYNNRGPGIQVGSANTKIYNNTVVNNTGTDQIWVYDDPRNKANPDTGNTGATQLGPDTVGTYLANNIVSGSVEAVRVQGTNTTGSNTVPSQFFDSYDYNVYYRAAGTGQTLLDWIPPSNRTYYTSLATITSALGLETHGQDIMSGSDPFFVNAAAGNYNLRSGNQAGTGTTIPSDVLSALGLSSGTGLPRGAISWPGQ